MKHALGQSGFDRYEDLLSDLFLSLANMDIKNVKRENSNKTLLAECKCLQKIRNDIIHKGESCQKDDAELALLVSVAVFEKIVRPMLYSLGLTVIERGEIVPHLCK